MTTDSIDLQSLKRILILGRSGSGKSTLANKLGKKLNLPSFHLDKLFWLPGWVERSKAKLAIDIENILATHPCWIIDGNYKSSAFEARIQAADLIVVLDFGFFASIWRVCKRNIIHWKKPDQTCKTDVLSDSTSIL